VVELLTQPHRLRSARVEGQIDHRALRAQAAQRFGEDRSLPPALEDHVRTPIAGAMAPATLHGSPEIAVTVVDRLES
jgi:hypothetical protein